MNIIVFDTETTGLLAPLAAGQEHQPYLVEFYGIRMTDKFEFREQLTFKCKPPIDMPAEAQKVHGISDANLKDAPPFVKVLPELTHFFLGASVAVGHNIMFDKMVLYWELYRLGKVTNFPWPPKDICTVEVSQQMNGFRMNLQDFHTHLFGHSFTGAHTANIDCEMTRRCFVELCKREMIVL